MWPIDSIVEKPANGYFLRDLLIFNGLNAGGFASKGFIFEPPDFNNAQIGELNEFQDQLSILLASLSDNYTAVYDDVTQRRQVLKGQMVGTIDRLQSSTTDAETQKLQGVVTAQSAQLQSIDNEIANAASQAVVQDISNRNNEAKQQQARNEEIAAERHDALKKFGTMMVPDVNSDVRFGRSRQ